MKTARRWAVVLVGAALLGFGCWMNTYALARHLTRRHTDEALLGTSLTLLIVAALWRVAGRARWPAAAGALSGYLAGIVGALVAFTLCESWSVWDFRPWVTAAGIATWSVLSYAWIMGIGLFLVLSGFRSC
jgi:hypothetical protein